MSQCGASGSRLFLSYCGEYVSVRADSAKLKFTGVNREPGANMDGTTYYTTNSVPRVLDISISMDCKRSLEFFEQNICCDATLELPDLGRTILLEKASLTGEAEWDIASGEITGLMLTFQSYDVVEDETSSAVNGAGLGTSSTTNEFGLTG